MGTVKSGALSPGASGVQAAASRRQRRHRDWAKVLIRTEPLCRRQQRRWSNKEGAAGAPSAIHTVSGGRSRDARQPRDLPIRITQHVAGKAPPEGRHSGIAERSHEDDHRPGRGGARLHASELVGHEAGIEAIGMREDEEKGLPHHSRERDDPLRFGFGSGQGGQGEVGEKGAGRQTLRLGALVLSGIARQAKQETAPIKEKPVARPAKGETDDQGGYQSCRKCRCHRVPHRWHPLLRSPRSGRSQTPIVPEKQRSSFGSVAEDSGAEAPGCC